MSKTETKRATPGQLAAKLNDTKAVSWASNEAFKDALKGSRGKPVFVGDERAVRALQPVILGELRAAGEPVDPVTLRQRTMALSGLRTASAHHVNHHSWALVRLLRTGQIRPVTVIGPRGGKRTYYAI